MSEKIAHLTSETFKSAVSSASHPLLVDFWATWCGPCKAIAPILEELAVELDGKLSIAKVNSDEQSSLAAEYGIRSIPTLLLFKGGKLTDQFVGFMPKSTLKARLAPHLAA